MSNLDLLTFCLSRSEPYVEDAYGKESVIIKPAGEPESPLMRANREIAEQITAYKVAADAGNVTMTATIIETLVNLLDTEGINNGEFANYWGVFDVSHSSYMTMSSDERRSFLRDILPRYIASRHAIYQSHGYSPNVLQVRSDSTAHKRSGQLGMRKVEAMLAAAGMKRLTSLATVDDFLNGDGVFIRTDSDGKALFKSVLEELGLWFRWSSDRQDKFPDIALRLGGRLSVVEHKHMKEGGWGQDKQIGELIDFIRQNDPQVSYVSFLDGVYFNELASSTPTGKTEAQLKQIRQALRANRYNYFVNTAGFAQRLQQGSASWPLSS